VYRNLMEVEKPSQKQKRITVGIEVTLPKRLLAILFAPAILTVLFWAFFIIEKDGLSGSLNVFIVLWGCINNIFTHGNTDCLPSLDYIIACSILGGPFAFYISYKWWKALRTKVILSNQSLLRKPPSGTGLQLRWSEIKKIYITENTKDDFINLIFTRNKRYRPFDNKNYIVLDAYPMSKKNWLWDAAGLILENIDRYKIPIKGERKILQEIANKNSKASPGPNRPAVSNMTGKNSLQARPSSHQTPTPK